MAVPAGTRLGHYEIHSALGAGGMGEVYLAEDTALGRKVAVKVLPADSSADAHARQRLVREARAAAALDHPHICAVYDVGEADGRLFIAMQYVEGETLDARLRRAAMPLGEVLAIGVDVADALTEAHAHGVLHRDIKPGNVMVTARGQAKVMDFGLAKVMRAAGAVSGETATGSTLTMSGALLGTVPYMSPEQVRGEDLDGRSDIFSLGVMLYEMLSGRRPFDDSGPVATASAILTRDPLPLARFAPDIPPELERIVTKTLRKRCDQRYQTASDLLIDLRTLKDDRDFQLRLERSSRAGHADGSGGGSSSASPAGLSSEPASSTASGTAPPRDRRSIRRWVIAAGLAALVAGAAWFAWRSANQRWASAQLPQIAALAEANRSFEAYDLAVAVERYLPGHPTLAGLMPSIADAVTVTTNPPGAQVSLKRFAPDATGVLPPAVALGTTPLTSVRVARGEYVLSVEKAGFAPIERTLSGRVLQMASLAIVPPPPRLDFDLVPLERMPDRMVSVPGSDYRLVAWSRPTDRRVRLADYFVDKYEVSNQEFKEFIAAGGYVKREYWTHAFVRDGKPVRWEDAMRTFVDRTGLQGPRAWSNQAVPEGKADHPVTGVTWYEAAAYAAFRGKRLPSVFQWEKAARDGKTGPLGSFMPWGLFLPGDTMAHRANFANAGTAAVTTAEFGMSPFGAYNMAGNVAEWTANDSSEGYLATGGGWADPIYAYAQFGPRPGFFSAETLGFRCALVATDAGDQGEARLEMAEEIPVYVATSDEAFARLSAGYQYAAAPLAARVEETIETPSWTKEKITFNGADGERAIGYLYLPRHVGRPLQVLHYVPGNDVDLGMRSMSASMDERLVPFVQSGRAAFGVVLKGYVERLRPAGYANPPPTSVEHLENVVSRVTDLRRGLDYLQTRDDIDAARITFFGISAGAQLGVVLAAVEPRYRAVLFIGSGMPAAYTRPYVAGANPANFASHITAPKLLVQGRYDEDTPLRTAAEPLFKLLREPKRMSIFDGGHVPPIEVQLRAAGPWLDEVLGPVRR